MQRKFSLRPRQGETREDLIEMATDKVHDLAFNERRRGLRRDWWLTASDPRADGVMTFWATDFAPTRLSPNQFIVGIARNGFGQICFEPTIFIRE